MIRVAINGFGRIGRHAAHVLQKIRGVELVAINDLTDTETLAHLFSYDTAYGQAPYPVRAEKKGIMIGKKIIQTFSEKDPSQLPWKRLKVDVVLECTGVFRSSDAAGLHLGAGAKKVIISAPAKGDDIPTFVMGVNHKDYAGERIVDNASCTTNCAAPVMKTLEDTFGVVHAMLTTVHSYTADQNLQDGPHKDLRRARAAAGNMVPTSTGAAIATAKAIPSLVQKFDGVSIRVPTLTVSLTDCTVVTKKPVTVEAVNAAFLRAEKGALRGILSTSALPLVSSDYIRNAASATVDLALTQVVDGTLLKVIAWYDNEWGYANRLVELAVYIGKR